VKFDSCMRLSCDLTTKRHLIIFKYDEVILIFKRDQLAIFARLRVERNILMAVVCPTIYPVCKSNSKT